MPTVETREINHHPSQRLGQKRKLTNIVPSGARPVLFYMHWEVLILYSQSGELACRQLRERLSFLFFFLKKATTPRLVPLHRPRSRVMYLFPGSEQSYERQMNEYHWAWNLSSAHGMYILYIHVRFLRIVMMIIMMIGCGVFFWIFCWFLVIPLLQTRSAVSNFYKWMSVS